MERLMDAVLRLAGPLCDDRTGLARNYLIDGCPGNEFQYLKRPET